MFSIAVLRNICIVLLFACIVPLPGPSQAGSRPKSDPVYLFFDDITAASIGKALADIVDNERKILIINSGGGNVEPAMAFYDLIRHTSKKGLETVAAGEIASSAVILFCSGQKRLIGENAYVYLHNIRMSFGNTKPTDKDIKDGEARVATLVHLYARIISETTQGRLSVEDVRRMMDAGTVLTAGEAVQCGLATDILKRPLF
jgi:ATP-dependent protease ClpP protease subunit